MNILIVGSGGREHAVGWKIKKDNDVNLYYAPGNGGTSINLSIQSNELTNLLNFAKKYKPLTIVGPEEPLAKGIVDLFIENDLDIFGPTQKAAILEYSKVWAKEFMKRYNIRTANFKVFDNPYDAKEYVKDKEDLVIKADGLAGGKGTYVCKDSKEANKAIDEIMINKKFGSSGNKIVIEDRLYGEELSFIVITDGKNVIPLAPSQDYKRLYDGDLGPNTGGMGAISPVPFVDDDIEEEIMRDIVRKTIEGMNIERREFKGFLYVGLMISNDKPYVLEFNVRLGDPETQVILPRMESNLLEYIIYAKQGRLDELEPIRWSKESAACVVLASNGYPEKYEKGKVIHGLEEASKKALIFHAGTTKVNNTIITNGGRVLCVTSIARDLREAITNVYDAINYIHFDNMYYRRDIGKKYINV